ncbi:ABC transporter ATP-binding protein [Hyphomicrobiales bacterium 4NK60-0047b]|jgi:lipoprotein-releasing system ATP-binding protein
MSDYYQTNQEQQHYTEQPKEQPKPILAIRDITKTYHQGTREIQVLNSISADIFKGEAIALVGPSGSGKSSLLHILGMLDKADNGKVYLNGQDCTNFDDAERTAIRRSDIGFVYQFHQLLPEFSALENVIIPQLINGHSRKTAEARAKVILEFLGLQERVGHRPNAMSGGEQQRVAIARAIANEPTLLLADEPTGNLDPNTAERVFQSLIGLIRQTGLAAIIATHNLELANRMDRVLQMQDGKLYSYVPQQQQQQ